MDVQVNGNPITLDGSQPIVWIVLLIVLYILVRLLIALTKRLFNFVRSQRTKRRYKQAGMFEIDRMDGIDFEHYLGHLFEQLAYSAKVTPASRDFGADLIIKKKGESTVVQAKRFSSNIGLEAVQQVAAARAYYKTDYALVVTNSYYSKNAKLLAAANSVELWDRDKLATMIIHTQN